MAAHARLMAELNARLMAGAGLSIADYEVLVHLSEASDGRLRVHALAERMQWDRSRLSHHLSRMERRGLVGREECATDARGSVVVTTDEGHSTLERAAPMHAADVRGLFVEPVGAALEELDRLSHRILGALEADRS